jgi:hypothetical protein
MAAQLNRWREDYATLVIDAIKASERRRMDLARSLDYLSECRERVTTSLDELATATDQRQWEAARFRTELAWSDLETTTAKLLQRVRAS